MTKIKSFDDLKKVREKMRIEMRVRENSNNPDLLPRITVSMGLCGISAGARDIMSFFIGKLAEKDVDAVVLHTDCLGYCEHEPVVEVMLPGKEPILYGDVDANMVAAIIEQHIVLGKIADGVIARK